MSGQKAPLAWMKIAAVILSKNPGNLAASAGSVLALDPAVQVYAVDDGLPKEGRDLAIRYLEGRKPFCFAKNANLGLWAAFYGGADCAILMNDDATLETPGGFSALADVAASNGGLISPSTDLRQLSSTICNEARVLPFITVAIPSSTWNILGPLDERLIHYGWEDNDYCRRALAAGLTLGIFQGCQVRHGLLPSTFRPGNGAGDVAPNGRLYAEKWAGQLFPAEIAFMRANGILVQP